VATDVLAHQQQAAGRIRPGRGMHAAGAGMQRLVVVQLQQRALQRGGGEGGPAGSGASARAT
jgi:hypothetical protein